MSQQQLEAAAAAESATSDNVAEAAASAAGDAAGSDVNVRPETSSMGPPRLAKRRNEILDGTPADLLEMTPAEIRRYMLAEARKHRRRLAYCAHERPARQESA